jgi:hypothetical protein
MTNNPMLRMSNSCLTASALALSAPRKSFLP